MLTASPVDVQFAATNNFFVYADDSVKGTGSSQATVTNPLNGKAVVLSSAGQFSDVAPDIDEQAGTITFHPTLGAARHLPPLVGAPHDPGGAGQARKGCDIVQR